MKINVVLEIGSECSILHKAFTEKENAEKFIEKTGNTFTDLYIEECELEGAKNSVTLTREEVKEIVDSFGFEYGFTDEVLELIRKLNKFLEETEK